MSNNFNVGNENTGNENEENSNIVNDEDKYYEENNSMNVSYEMDNTFPNTGLRENEITNHESNTLNTGNGNTNLNIRMNNFHNDNTNTTNNLNSNNLLINRESSLNEFSNFNLNVYSEFTGNNFEANSESGYLNRNFDSHLDEIFDNLTYLITNEKNNMKTEKLNLQKSKHKFIEFKNQEVLKLEKDKEQWKENLKIVDSLKCSEADVLDLDIGGTHKISTTRSTLAKYPNSALAAMFSGRHEIPKHNSRLFIDRDGLSFLNMVNFLRSGKFPLFKDKNEEINFFEELEFWQIPIYEGKENSLKNMLQFDPEWCANTLIIENNNTVIKKHSKQNLFLFSLDLQHGIVFCKTPMDVHCPYIEFKVIMNIPCRGKSHLFIGLVDKSKYKYENLVSTFWKDSPSSFYWDVWNTKLIKTDENGIQVGSVSGYGCQCEEYETKISIKYDHKSRTVAFYKNGNYQGIAFRNVPSGLSPSLDVWFESGSVEIMRNTNVQEKIYL